MQIAFLAIPWATGANAGELTRTEEVRIESQGVTLAGSILFPASGKIHAGVVFVHGSGPQLRDLRLAERFASEGIAALVYDKRGVGKSGGKYEQDRNVSGPNIDLLAEDAAAALKTLAAHRSMKNVPVGFTGISQAGWIVPLAAEKNRSTQFIVLWSGPVCKVSEEDIYSKYTTDADQGAVPPYREALESRKQQYIWPDFLGVDTDPNDSLGKLQIRGLWVFSDNDGSIPVDLSLSRLQILRKANNRYDYALFSGLGHNNIDPTFATVADWIKRNPK